MGDHRSIVFWISNCASLALANGWLPPTPPPLPHPTPPPQVRGRSAEGFGKGRTRRMPLAAFLARLRAGDASLYLSSQQQPLAADGFPELLAPPLAALRGHMPLRPALMGHLVPQQVGEVVG